MIAITTNKMSTLAPYVAHVTVRRYSCSARYLSAESCSSQRSKAMMNNNGGNAEEKKCATLLYGGDPNAIQLYPTKTADDIMRHSPDIAASVYRAISVLYRTAWMMMAIVQCC